MNRSAFFLFRNSLLQTIAQNKGAKVVWTHKMSRIAVFTWHPKSKLLLGTTFQSRQLRRPFISLGAKGQYDRLILKISRLRLELESLSSRASHSIVGWWSTSTQYMKWLVAKPEPKIDVFYISSFHQSMPRARLAVTGYSTYIGSEGRLLRG